VNLLSDKLRRNAVKLTYTAADEGAKGLAMAHLSHAVAFSDVQQVVNGISHASGRFASWEPDFWRLDGSFMLPSAGEGLETGFVSHQISLENGTFAINGHPELEIRFTRPVNLPAITLVFDGDGACRNAQILCHNAFGTIIAQQFINNMPGGDGNVPLIMQANGANGVSRITIRLMRTNVGRRRARVTEVHFGHIWLFDGDDILSANTIHQGDGEGKGLPWNQIRTAIANKGRFNALDGGKINQLAKGAKLEYTVGTGTFPHGKMFWTKYADYLLDEWNITNNKVEFTAHSKARLLSDTTFMGSNFALEHMGDLARRIGREAGVNVITPHAMNTYPRFPGFVGNVSHRKALAYLAELASCAIFEDRQGNIHFMDLLSPRQPALAPDLDFEQQFAPPEIAQNNRYNGILLTERMISLDDGWLANVQLDVEGFLDITIPYDAPVWLTPAITVNTGFSLQNIEMHTMFTRLRVVAMAGPRCRCGAGDAHFLQTKTFTPPLGNRRMRKSGHMRWIYPCLSPMRCILIACATGF